MSGQSPDFEKHQPPEQPGQGAQGGFPASGPYGGSDGGYGPVYGAGASPWAPPPEHPGANSAMVLGIVALAGGYLCALPLLCGPFAWVQGNKVRREIDADPSRWSGRNKGTAAMVMGIIATVGLVIILLVVVIVVLVAILTESSSSY